MTWPNDFLLELGSGENPYDDGRNWYHQDIRYLPDMDFVCPAEKISTVIDSPVVVELRAAHILEHFSHLETVNGFGRIDPY